jgi:hypothetical protein
MDVEVIKQHQLPARELIGADHGGAGVCVIFVEHHRGTGPSLHKHPYRSCSSCWKAKRPSSRASTRFGGAGDIVIVPPNTRHAFTNAGEQRLRQIDIHVNPTFNTKWL